jgi:hypothetical protein
MFNEVDIWLHAIGVVIVLLVVAFQAGRASKK